MSPRPTRLRRISNPPLVSGFKPYGGVAVNEHPQSVFMHLEEYEVIRLCDFENMNHHEAARLMDVSRPTLTRIYAKARATIADAIVSGKQIIIEGGKIYFDSEWFKCNGCNCLFNQPEKSVAPSNCPLCGSERIVNYIPSDEAITVTRHSNVDVCVCPDCGFEKQHEQSHPCKEEICPECSSRMMRKNNLLAKDM